LAAHQKLPYLPFHSVTFLAAGKANRKIPF
jgi:hypothetical protein